MMRRLYKFLCYFLVALFLASYAFAEPKTVFLNKGFIIKTGESVQIEGGLGFIEFIKVIEDSRCPSNVTCVWAGNVKIEFKILDSERKKTSLFLNSSVKPNKILLKGYSLQLISIAPSKIKGIKIPLTTYQVKLRVEPST